MAWVLNYSPVDLNGTEQSVAIALANYATDEGGRAYPSVSKLASITHWKERTVQSALRSLTEKGVIDVEHPATNKMPAVYCFPLFRGAGNAPPGVQEMHPKKSLGVHLTASRGERGAPKPLVTTNISITTEPAPVPEETESENPPDVPTTKPPRKKPAAAKREQDHAYWQEGGHRKQFGEWYAAYPRKKDPQGAMKAWRLVLGDDDADERTMTALWGTFREHCKEWRGRQAEHVPYPATWLNKREWEFTRMYLESPQ